MLEAVGCAALVIGPIMTQGSTSLDPPTVQNGASIRFFLQYALSPPSVCLGIMTPPRLCASPNIATDQTLPVAPCSLGTVSNCAKRGPDLATGDTFMDPFDASGNDNHWTLQRTLHTRHGSLI